MATTTTQSNQDLYGQVVSDVLDRLDILSASCNSDGKDDADTRETTAPLAVTSLTGAKNKAIKEIEIEEKKKPPKKRKKKTAAVEGEKSRPRKKRALGPDDTPKSLQAKWDEMFDRLVEYKKKHGNCLVPNRYAEDKSLGAWVSTQRRQYKVLISGSCRSTPMCPDRARRLNEIGFKWQTTDPRHTPWMQRYEQLLEFHKAYGHSLVPIGFTDNAQLANWVSTQRQEYKNFCDGKPARINKQRIKLLNKIGFVWDAQRGNLRMHSRYREKLEKFCESSDEENISADKEDENDGTDKKISPDTTTNQQESETSQQQQTKSVITCLSNTPNKSNVVAAIHPTHGICASGLSQSPLAANIQANNMLAVRRLRLMQLHAAGSPLIGGSASSLLQNTHTNKLPNLNTGLSPIGLNHLSMSPWTPHGFVPSSGAIRQLQIQAQLAQLNSSPTTGNINPLQREK